VILHEPVSPPRPGEVTGIPSSGTARPVIRLQKASKWYGDVIGINQVDLELGKGVIGLLGPNGAGKSTMLKLLTGQLKPGSGTVEVFDVSPWKNPEVFRLLGFCPDTDAFYEDMSGLEFVTLMGRLGGYGAAESERRARAQLDRVSMTAHCDKRIRGYSKGMRQRTKLAAALLHDPELIILDEPLNGLDPVGRREMLNLFRALGAEGKTVLVSSHILHEIEGLTQQIALIHHGRIVAEGKIEEIRALIENQPLTLQISTPKPRQVGSMLAGIEGIRSLVFPEEGGIVLRSAQPERVYDALQTAVLSGDFAVTGLLALDDNLDAIFQYLVKE